MGTTLTLPKTEKASDQGEGLGLRYSICSMQGYRPEMEDAHDVKIGLKYGLSDWSYFAVFDGHAGKRAAESAACNLLEYILRDNQFELVTDNLKDPLFFVEPPDESSSGESNHECSSQKQVSFHSTIVKKEDESSESPKPKVESDVNSNEHENGQFSKCPNQETSSSTKHEQKSADKTEKDEDVSKPKLVSFPISEQLDMVTKAIRSGFLKLDQSMRMANMDMSGCTAVCTFISPTHIFIANCGDSRAVLFDGFKTKFSTEDHKPFKPSEKTRIVKAGGIATQRINGTLAVSRALGDFEFKKDSLRGPCEQLVSPEPEVTVLERHPYDEFLILACDGIWDVMNNDELCRFIHHQLYIEPDLDKICSLVLDVCLRKGSRDNMSIILIVFESAPKFDKLALATDKRHDQVLLGYANTIKERENITDKEGAPVSFPVFYSVLKSEIEQDPEISPILPPGAGIDAKYELFRETYDETYKENTCQEEKE